MGEQCRSLGFALWGVCDAAPPGRAGDLIKWLEAGKHGSMSWLARNVEERTDPARLLPGARSVILVADLYARRGESDPPAAQGAPPRGRIARYARGRDYHKVMKRRLLRLCDSLRADHPEAKFRAFVDTAPVLERDLAARAGLGWIGKHTLLINARLGSYFLLGGVLTTLDLSPPPAQRPVADHCGTCTRCIDACPTDAITPYSVDARRCISYLTIEHREPIEPAFFPAIGDWIFGCDICQEVCPHNAGRQQAPGNRQQEESELAPTAEYAPRHDSFDLLEVLGWTEADRRRAFESSALKRARLDMMKRNALIAAANGLAERENPSLRARIDQIAQDPAEPELVRSTAQQVIDRVNLPRG